MLGCDLTQHTAWLVPRRPTSLQRDTARKLPAQAGDELLGPALLAAARGLRGVSALGRGPSAQQFPLLWKGDVPAIGQATGIPVTLKGPAGTRRPAAGQACGRDSQLHSRALTNPLKVLIEMTHTGPFTCLKIVSPPSNI